jgi:hypothetical protein
MSSAKRKKSGQGREAYIPYSKLTKAQRDEIRDEPLLRPFMRRFRDEDWKFMKTKRGWVPKR